MPGTGKRDGSVTMMPFAMLLTGHLAIAPSYVCHSLGTWLNRVVQYNHAQNILSRSFYPPVSSCCSAGISFLLSNRSSGTVHNGPPTLKIGLLLYGTKDPPDVIVRDRLLT